MSRPVVDADPQFDLCADRCQQTSVPPDAPGSCAVWPLKRHLRHALDKELSCAILDGRIGGGSRLAVTDAAG